MASAIDWFFQREKEGIILEDDCLPSPEFFTFCDTLLERYRHDPRIRHIGGTNVQFGKNRGDASYYFSRLVHVWGWASWRRAWKDYDKNLSRWTEDEIGAALDRIFHEPLVAEQWRQIVSKLKANQIDTWDYQWGITNFVLDGLSVIPNQNLITNIGFGPGATHTINVQARHAAVPHGSLGSLTHPSVQAPNEEADFFTLSEEFQLEKLRAQHEAQQRKYKRFKYRLKRWIARHGGPKRWINAGK
ncbi:MAG: hypothetical protein QM790_00570 [Nibricoccus sp.]